MSNQLKRRDFLCGWIATTSVLLASLHLKPLNARAGVAEVLNFLELSNPFLAVVALVELGTDYVSGGENQRKLADIASQLITITGKQDLILEKLAEQRIVMREEIKRGFLNNDVHELWAMAQHFKIALVSDDKTRDETMHSIAGRIDELAVKIAAHGLAAMPAYLAAITLENGVHYILKSSPQVFITINEGHRKTLETMLNGDGPETLSSYINTHTQNQTTMNVENNPLFDFGKLYRIAIVSKIYESGAWALEVPASSYNLVYSYEGFHNGQPILKRHDESEVAGVWNGVAFTYSSDIKGRKVLRTVIWFTSVGGADYLTASGIEDKLTKPGERLVINTNIDPAGRAILAGETLEIVELKIRTIYDYYMKLYEPSMGPDITRESINQLTIRPNEEQENMRKLLQRGLDYVDRILAVKRRELAQGSGAPAEGLRPRL